MRWIINIYRIFAGWFQPKYSIDFYEDLPLSLKRNTVYVIGDKEDPWQVAFICPCGCKSTIQLNLLKDSSPKWNILYKGNLATIYPSIHKKTGCKSHFYLRNGNIVWAGSS